MNSIYTAVLAVCNKLTRSGEAAFKQSKEEVATQIRDLLPPLTCKPKGAFDLQVKEQRLEGRKLKRQQQRQQLLEQGQREKQQQQQQQQEQEQEKEQDEQAVAEGMDGNVRSESAPASGSPAHQRQRVDGDLSADPNFQDELRQKEAVLADMDSTSVEYHQLAAIVSIVRVAQSRWKDHVRIKLLRPTQPRGA